MFDRKVLVVGNDHVALLVSHGFNGDRSARYHVVSYLSAQSPGEREADWSKEAIRELIQREGKAYAAVVVDYAKRELAPAVKPAGYGGLVVGLTSTRHETIPGTDLTVVLREGEEGILKDALDARLDS